MKFHILTLFPEMVMNGLGTSITGRAMASGAISVDAIDIRDYSKDKHRHVDDAPYGGGAGMVMQPGPVCDAYEDLCNRTGKKPRVIYMTPQGRVFNQSIAEELAQEEELVFLCGHYEGIDERALELIVTDYLSVGDFVLTGGELPAMVMIDCISRLVPGVLNNEVSAEVESFHDNLLEYPQYTRPEVFRGKEVPEVLLSGHHKNIEEWRRKESIRRTLERRPDLLPGASLTLKEHRYLDSLKGGEDGLVELEEILDGYAAEAERLFCKRDGICGQEDRAAVQEDQAAVQEDQAAVQEDRQSAREDRKVSGLTGPLPGLGEPAPRIKRRAMSEVKKLLALDGCTLNDVKSYYKVCKARLKLIQKDY